jgi:hypothetical protein
MLLAALVAIPGWCGAAESCLWLNDATAAGILGGTVTSQVLHLSRGTSAAGTANAKSSAGPMNANASAPSYVTASTDDEDCTFARRASAISSEMRIEVRTMYRSHMEFTSRLASCGSDKVSLRAIGNEAVACDTGREAGGRSEQVVGRVRDRVFLVRVTSNDTATDRAALRESAKTAAEIVAGNLF